MSLRRIFLSLAAAGSLGCIGCGGGGHGGPTLPVAPERLLLISINVSDNQPAAATIEGMTLSVDGQVAYTLSPASASPRATLLAEVPVHRGEHTVTVTMTSETQSPTAYALGPGNTAVVVPNTPDVHAPIAVIQLPTEVVSLANGQSRHYSVTVP